LRNGDTRSCGCIKSAGEVLVRQILTELKYIYKQEHSFYDLKSPFSNCLLRFDFGLFTNENKLIGLIEYQGQ